MTGAVGCNTGGGPGNNAASACKTRVWFSRSTNGGAIWSAPVMLNNQASLNDQFHSKLCVDESNGNLIVTYRDTVNDPSRLQTDVFMQTSSDDGQTWSTPVRVTSGRSDETTAGHNPNQYADYDGLTGFDRTFFPAWTDRRTGGVEEIWSSKLSFKLERPSRHYAVAVQILLGLIQGGPGVVPSGGPPVPVDPGWEIVAPEKWDVLPGLAITELAKGVSDPEARQALERAGWDAIERTALSQKTFRLQDVG